MGGSDAAGLDDDDDTRRRAQHLPSDPSPCKPQRSCAKGCPNFLRWPYLSVFIVRNRLTRDREVHAQAPVITLNSRHAAAASAAFARR